MDIEVKNIKKSFCNKKVLNNINIHFAENKIHCIIGSSGCGKTTLLNIILGIEDADSGYIEGVKGRKISAVFQEDRLCDGFSAKANVRLVCNNRISDEEIFCNFKQVDLEDANKPVSQFSGGMRRRVAIVRAIMAGGDILIMDEPFKGLDEKTKIMVINYVKKCSVGKTVIITTHNIEEVEMLKATLVKM